MVGEFDGEAGRDAVEDFDRHAFLGVVDETVVDSALFAVGAAAPVCTTATVRVLVQQPAPVPTLSQWALMLLAGLMALGAARRRNA